MNFNDDRMLSNTFLMLDNPFMVVLFGASFSDILIIYYHSIFLVCPRQEKKRA